jgi:hypothetical protein
LTDERLDYGSPIAFSLKQRLILATVPRTAASAARLLYATSQIRETGAEHWVAIASSGHFLAGIWHETLGLMACRFRGTGFHTLTSSSFDGELAARAAKHFGIRALRGSSSKGGVKALSQLALATESVQVVGLTLDGPRGPRRVAKPGLAYLSAWTQLPVIVVAGVAEPAWRMRSWDRLQIPKPFCGIRFAYSEPIAPPGSTDSGEVEAMRVRMESALNALHGEIEGGRGE